MSQRVTATRDVVQRRFSESRARDGRRLAGKEWNGQRRPWFIPSWAWFRARAGKISYDKNGHHQPAPAQDLSPGFVPCCPKAGVYSPLLSVRENLLLGMRGKGWTPEKRYSLFPVLERRAGHMGVISSAAANSRCWPLPGRCWRTPTLSSWTSPLRALRRSLSSPSGTSLQD